MFDVSIHTFSICIELSTSMWIADFEKQYLTLLINEKRYKNNLFVGAPLFSRGDPKGNSLLKEERLTVTSAPPLKMNF